MKKGFRKTISLESNQSRLTMEGALTAAAIGLMMMLVLQQQQTQASGGEEVQGNPRPNFDATRVPTGRIAVSQASTQDATRLRQASPFTAQDLGDVRIDDTKHKNGGSATSPRISFGLTDGRAPYGGGYGGSAQGSSGTYGAENSSGRSNGGYRSSSSSQTTQQSTQQSEAPSIGASTGPGRGASGAPITIDTTGLSSGEAANAMAATPSAGAAVGPGKGATGVAGVADQSSIQSGKAGAAVQELASAGALAGPSKGATGLAGSFTGNLNSGGGGAPEVVKPSAATASLEYHAFDGPMAGSTAYIDTNNNGFFDPGDWYTYTDDQGYFNIDYVDSNKNGTWEQTEALKRGDGSTYYLTEGASLQVHVIGGTDTVSNSLNRHEMLTSLSGTGGVVSPITTLVEGISKDLGVANAEAEAMVGKILGIDSTVDLLKYDPFSITVSNSRSLDNNNIALDYKVKAAQIFNLGYVTEAVAGQESFNGLQSLGNELLKAATHSDGSIGSLDLTANDDLKKYFSGLSSSISAGALDAFTSITQQANSLIKQSGASGEVLSVISSDRSIDGLGSNKLLNKGIDSSRDLLADVLKKDESFADRGAAKLFWSDANVADGSIAFEALHNFIGLPSDIHSYASLPDVQLQAEHRGETNAIAAKGNAVVSTYETVSLLKDTTLDYSHYTAKPSSLSNAVAAANKSAAVIAPDATTGIKLSDTPISKAIQTASTTSTTAAAESSTSAAGSTTSSTPSTAASSTVATSTVAASTSASLPSISANNAAQITGATVKTNGSGRVIQLPDASSTANTNQINSASNSSNSNTVSSESTGSSSSSGPPSSSSSNSSSGSSSNSSSGSSSSTSSSSASDANQNSSPNSTTNSSSTSTAPSNSGSSNSGSSNSGSSSASASNSDSSSGASAGSSTASSNTQTADNNTSKASIEESKSSAVETSKTQEAPADTSKTEVSSNNSSNSNSNSSSSESTESSSGSGSASSSGSSSSPSSSSSSNSSSGSSSSTSSSSASDANQNSSPNSTTNSSSTSTAPSNSGSSNSGSSNSGSSSASASNSDSSSGASAGSSTASSNTQTADNNTSKASIEESKSSAVETSKTQEAPADTSKTEVSSNNSSNSNSNSSSSESTESSSGSGSGPSSSSSSNSSSGSSSSTSSSSASDANQNSSPNSTTNSSSTSTAPSNSGSSNSGSSNSGSSSASASNSDSSSGASAGSSTASSNTQTADNNTSKASIEESKSSAVETSKTQEAPADTSKTEVSSNNSSNSNSNSNTSTGSTSSIPAASFTSSTSPSGEAYTAGTASADHTIPVIKESSALATASQANGQHSDVIASVAIEPTTYQSLPNNPLAGSHEQAAIPAASFTSSTSPSGEAYTAGTASADHTIPVIKESSALATASQANSQHSDVIASVAIEPTTYHSLPSDPLAGAHEQAAQISKDLSVQPSSVFNGEPILLEAIHDHSINAQALDGSIEADISQQTRVLDRSTLLMGGQDDVLRVEAITDIHISLFESMGVELHGEISSVAMEFSKIDMGAGDDIIEINSVLSLNIDSSEDIAKLIGDINQEELGMLDSILMGGDGNDTMIVNGAARSRIDGGTGNDDIYLTGESQYVTLDGGAGDDRIFGTNHSETLIGGDGDDLLFGHGGLDEMTGGRGSDIFIVDTDEGVDLGNLNALSDFEKTILSGKISNAELASITDFNGMEGDAIALRSASIGVTQRAEDLFVYTPAASDMDKQVLLLSNFDEFFFSGQVEIKEGYALLTDLDTLVQVTDDGHLHALAHVSSQVTPSNGMVFTTNNSLSS